VRRILISLTLVCSFASSPQSSQADLSTIPVNTWVTGRAVRAVARVGDRLFVGGDFTSVYPRSRYTGSLATFAHGDENPIALPALSGGDVTAITDDGAGGWYAAGTFTRAGNVPLDLGGTPRLVHVRSDGSVRQIPPQGVAGTSALGLARSGTTLMLAYVREVPSGRIFLIDYFLASFDATTGVRRAADIPVIGPITAIAADQSRFYVLGHFNQIAGTSRTNAAAIDAASLTLTPWAPTLNPVTHADLDGTTIYVATFDQVRRLLAAVSTSDGSFRPWTPFSPCAPTGLAAGPDAVYIASCASSAADGLVTAYHKTTGARLGWSVTTNGAVSAIDVSGSHLYIAGDFTTVAGEVRTNAAAFTNRTLDTWNPRPSMAATRIVAAPDRAALAGGLSGLGAEPRPRLAEFDARTGELSPWVPTGVSRWPVYSLSSEGRWLFVLSGGPCQAFFGCDAVAIALDGSGLVVTLPYPRVDAVAATRNRLYVGGDFGLTGFDTRTGAQLPWHLPTHIRKILATESALYAVPYESPSLGRVLKIDPRNGQVLPWGPVTTSAAIGELTLAGPLLVASIATRGLSPANELMAVDAGSGAIVAEAPRSLVPTIDVYPPQAPFSPLINPPNWFPFTGGLAASRRFIVFSSNGLVRTLNPASGGFLPWTVSLDKPAPTLYAGDSVIVVGGDFTYVDGIASPGLAIFLEELPAAPSNLNATVSGSMVQLEWTPAPGVVPSDYRLEAGTRPGVSDIGVLTLPPTPSFQVAGVADGRYYVRVRAANAAGVGAPSNEVEVIVGTPGQ
jgi:hypothetical protein